MKDLAGVIVAAVIAYIAWTIMQQKPAAALPHPAVAATKTKVAGTHPGVHMTTPKKTVHRPPPGAQTAIQNLRLQAAAVPQGYQYVQGLGYVKAVAL